MRSQQVRLLASLALFTALGSAALGAQTSLLIKANATPLLTQNGAANGDAFGRAVCGWGDVNGDGFDDVLAGGPFSGFGKGYVRVLSGADGALLQGLVGDAIADQFGWSVGGGGDANGDGFDDFIVGANTASTNTGYARVFSGADYSVLYTFTGLAINDFYGWSVDVAGDVDQDGRCDFIIGAPQPGSGTGYVEVRSGRDGSLLYFYQAGPTVNFGQSVSGAGDVNADGHDDFMVGDPGAFNWGNVRVFSGLDGSLIYTLADGAGSSNFGFAIAGAGDVNEDGFADVVCSVDHSVGSGRVRVYSGATGLQLFTAVGDKMGDRFGQAVAGGIDMNGDGNCDVIVGAPEVANLGAGYVRVLSGADGSVLYTLDGNASSDRFGFAVAAGGNIDSDGFGDLIVGVAGVNNSRGRVQAFALGAHDQHAVALTVVSAPPGANAGSATSSIGDITGDGIADYAVGAPNNSTGAFTGNGSVWVYSGATNTPLYQFDGDASGDLLGASVAAAGDVDNDGVPDIIAGAPGNSAVAAGSGLARVYSGADGSVILNITGLNAADALGTAVGGVGDLNGDNHDDVLVGVPGLGLTDFGAVRVVSGLSGSALFVSLGVLSNEGLGSAVAAIGDVNSDGVTDYLAGAPQAMPAATGAGLVRVFSGVNGAQIFAAVGDAFGDGFGCAVSAAGDVNRDDVPDFVVGAPFADPGGNADAGYARILSGLNGGSLFNLNGAAAGDLLGSAVAGANDLDLDGFADALFGAPGANGLTGEVRVVSGRNGANLQTVGGTAAGDQFGASIAALGDVNDDAYADFVVGSPSDALGGVAAGSVTKVDSRTFGSPGLVIDYGAGCDSSSVTLPRIGVEGVPALNETFDITLRTATPNAVTLLCFGQEGSEISLEINPFSAPGCFLLVDCLFSIGTGNTDPLGRLDVPVTVPPLQSIVDVAFNTQFVVFDAAANLQGFVMSDGQAVRIGQSKQ